MKEDLKQISETLILLGEDYKKNLEKSKELFMDFSKILSKLDERVMKLEIAEKTGRNGK